MDIPKRAMTGSCHKLHQHSDYPQQDRTGTDQQTGELIDLLVHIMGLKLSPGYLV